MIHDADARTLTLDFKDCYCDDGTQNGRKDCPTCKGTGCGPRGGKGKCRPCHGSGWLVDTANPVPCQRCKGDWQHSIPENWTDNAPDAVVQALPHKVVRIQRRQTALESLIGIGLWSCTDYGTAWAENDDEALIAKVRADERHVQACKVTRKTDDPQVLALCDGILIDVHPNGYNVVGFFSKEA
jgi:hypothetical protein